MTSVTITNICGAPVDVVYSGGGYLPGIKRVNNGEKISFPTKWKLSREVQLSRTTHPNDSISYKVYNGQFVVDHKGLRNLKGTNRYRLWHIPDNTISVFLMAWTSLAR